MRTAFSVAVLACALLAAGCGKKTSTSSAGGQAAIELGSVPASAQAVIGADVSKLAVSRLVELAIEQMYERDPGLQERVASLREACGIDPVRDVPRVVIGMGPESEQVVLVAAGSFEDKQLATCLNKSMGAALTAKKVDGRSFYRVEGKYGEIWLAVGSNGTLAVSPSEAWLRESLGSGPKVGETDAMRRVIGNVDRGAAIWLAGRVPPSVGSGVVTMTKGAVAEPPEAIYAELGLAEGLAVDMGVIMGSAKDAEAAASKAVFELGLGALVAQRFGLGPLVSQVEASHDGEIVKFSLNLTMVELNQLLAGVSSLAPDGKPEPGPDDSSELPGLDSEGSPLQDSAAPNSQN